MNYIAQYNDLLQRGEIPACRRVKAVYARLAEETRTPGQYVFDEAKADRPIAFMWGCMNTITNTPTPYKGVSA